MNKIILTVQGYLLYPENYTEQQLKENHYAAISYLNDNPTDPAHIAVYAAAIDTYATYDANSVWTDDDATQAGEYWLNEYFKLTGENRQDYIDEINKEYLNNE